MTLWQGKVKEKNEGMKEGSVSKSGYRTVFWGGDF